LIQDPISVVEQIAQSVNDTYEHEGIAYITGEALTVFVPGSLLKVTKMIPKVKGAGKTKVSNFPYSKEFFQGKIAKAMDGLGNVKLPTVIQEKLSTGIVDIPTVKVEWKKLSEAHPRSWLKVTKMIPNVKGVGKTKVSNFPYSKEFFQGKIAKAMDGLGNVKLPTVIQEKLSTGIVDIPTIKVEWKKLSETHPQMFAVKGEG
jgi:hypothetical protein